MNSVLQATLIAAVSCAFASAAAAQESWTDKIVFIKKGPIKIDNTDANGMLVQVGELRAIAYKALADKEDRLQVSDGRGNTGWFDKADAVPLDDAVQYFTRRIDTNENDVAAYNSRAWAWKLKGDLGLALSDFDAVVRLDPRAYAYANRGAVRVARKEIDKALADFNDALRLEPENVGALHSRGNLWAYHKKEFDKAITDYDEALRLDPKNVPVVYERARAWIGKKDYVKAVADFDEAIRVDPKYAIAYNDRAWLWATCPDAKHRDGKKAVASAKQALALSPKDAGIMDTLAAAYAESGDFVEAVHWQEKALADPQFKNNADYRRRLELFRAMKPYRQE